MRRLTISRLKFARQHSSSPQFLLSRRVQRRNDLATIISYDRFCRLGSGYRHSMANQIRIMGWIDERRIEMLAEGRPHWVPSMRDFEMAVRDCRDDLVNFDPFFASYQRMTPGSVAEAVGV